MYSLIVIRLNKETRQFENTETHEVVYSIETLKSQLLGIPTDETGNEITNQIAELERGISRKCINLTNSSQNKLWFCYITKMK